MKKLGMTLLAAMTIIFHGCSTQTFNLLQDKNNTSSKSVSDSEYGQETQFEWKIAKGDRIEIVVVNQSGGDTRQELNVLLNTAGGSNYTNRDGTEGFLIPADGAVRLPLVGAVKLAGLTETQATDKLTTEYRKYLRNPFVSVKILNQKLFVLGEVRKPGVVQVTNGTMSLFEALAHSGDLTDDAERTNLKVIRGGLREPIVREINLANLSEMKLTSLLLQPNDIVYIQPRSMKSYNVAFREQMPFFDMLTSMLNPFVSYTTIKNGEAVDIFLFK